MTEYNKLNSNIISTGCYVPETIINNSDLVNLPPSVLSLIEMKTGVKSRRFATDSQCTSDLAIIAATSCLSKINFDPSQLDALILATSSPDRIQPATATRVQYEIEAMNAFAFDINSVCSGGVFALTIADSLIKSNRCKNILIIAVDIYSKFLDKSDLSTFPYFGDGAGSILLSARNDTKGGILNSVLKTDGSKADIVQIPAGGTKLPFDKIINHKDIYFKMVGREVYQFAVKKGTEIIEGILDNENIHKDQIKLIIIHQANINIIKEISTNIGIHFDKFIINLDRYGNTAAASVFIALDEAIELGRINRGDLFLMVAFGGGLSWGANLIRY